MQLDLLKREDLPKDIITVSPSQMSMWYRCRYAWKLAKIDNVGQETYKTIGAANKGLIFHSFMQWYHNASRGRAVGTLSPKGKELALDFVKSIHGSDPDLWRVYTIFIAYTEFMAKHEEMVPLYAEQETWAPTGLISVDGRPIFLHGFIDLISELFNDIIVTDHKSHTSKPWTRSRLFYDHQFIFYWLMLELQGISVGGACVNAIDLAIPANEKLYNPNWVGPKNKRRPRFERFMLSKKDVKLQFYLDEFLKNIRAMWCTPDPTYEMRLSPDCQYCSFHDHIEMDARGMGEGALIMLQARHNTEDFELIDDDEGDVA